MQFKLLPVSLFALGISATAAQDPCTTTAPSATIQGRQVEFTSFGSTFCTISSGLAVPQPTGAVCGLAAASVASATSQLIEIYTDFETSASYIACSKICLATRGCTQIFFLVGSGCSLYRGNSLFAKATSDTLYYDLACFECYQDPLTSSTSSTRSASSTRTAISSPVKPSTTSLTPSTTVTTASTSSHASSTWTSTWTSVETNPISYLMALTAVFTPPPECTGSFTQIGTNYWQDAIVPAPHMTLTSCYPSEFYSSAVGAANSVSLPPFNPLVCPSSWSALPYNSTYFMCCPDGWGAFAPYLSNTQRPLSGAVCTSPVFSGMVIDVTSYDDAGSMAILPLTVGSIGVPLLVTGFDGIVGVAGPTGTTTSVPTSTHTLEPTSVSIGHAARLRWFAQ